ncbi:MAG TPA: FAD-binding oxidoreductase [Candidatus Hydrogenedentes bacterium]|nr:FAD-binding oxidoreductase [Candidatus Hydrogenedentota bacterium]HNT87520.1 FAD-binding oxidoreductase [Candidatus Hydrogenedentota bacterium]
MSTPDIEAFLRAMREVLPDDAVCADATARDRYARTTQPAGTRPAAVLFPATTEEVAAIVRLANDHRVALYPISRGRNLGYGDACAPTEGAVILDLGRMNRILELDTRLGYVVIEPGVTQQQLFDHLRRHAPDYWMDATGAGPDASIVGNALERGFGHTPYGDHVRTTCGIEVVLPNGRAVLTGFGHHANARTVHVYPYGVGPAVDGLFMQSNLGIVTKLGLWLQPAPRAFTFFYVKVDRDAALEPVIDRLRALRMDGVLNSAVHVGNDLRIVSSQQQYPWEAADGRTPLPDPVRAALRARWGVGAWNVSGSLTGTRDQVRGARRMLKRAMRGLGRVVFVDDARLALGNWVAGALGRFGLGARLRRQLEALRPNYGLLKGIPTDFPLQALAWRLRKAPAQWDDPLAAACGLLWISPVVPATGEDARAVLDIVAPRFHEAGFDLLATFTFINERAMIGIFNISFDKTLSEECAAAARCYHAVMDALLDAGYPPYRVAVHGMARLWRDDDTFQDLLRDLKRALDPAGILAPGRYIPEESGAPIRHSRESGNPETQE